MLSFDTLAVFSTASFLLALAPGPDNIFVLSQAAVHGRFSGIIITFGLCTGLIFHTAVAAFGISALFMTSAAAFNALKYAGAAYLLYIAYRTFTAEGFQTGGTGGAALSPVQLYRRGIIMNITNPKVSIFFLAFLPQFAVPHGLSLPLQMILLGLVFIIITALVFSAIAVLAGSIGNYLKKSDRAGRIINILAGTALVLLAARLAFAQR
jgi:threonine/homoserine/homoserine lactone efflux protein